MRSYLRMFGVAMIGAGLCLLQGTAAIAGGCYQFSGTADGFDQETGVSRAQLALADAINQHKKAKKIGKVTVTAMRAEPQPYWRGSVWDELYYKPDIVKSNSYTICWHGVVSPYVCTSGAKVCW
jgi:hypothetical protein